MKNIEYIGGGLICDNPKCNWEDKNIPFEDYAKHLNRKCPKCGENVLTEEDFENVKRLHKVMDFVNSLSGKQIDSISELLGGAKTQKKTEDKKVILTVKTHKGIKMEIYDATTKNLSDNCPKCGAKLYAYYHENVSGDTCTGTWNVKCTKCDYVPEEYCFGSIDGMNKCFDVVAEKMPSLVKVDCIPNVAQVSEQGYLVFTGLDDIIKTLPQDGEGMYFLHKKTNTKIEMKIIK